MAGKSKIIEDVEGSNRVLWSFTPETHPAHPTAIKRKIVEKEGTIYIQMTALCEAKKAACDKLIGQFENLNEKISSDSQG